MNIQNYFVYIWILSIVIVYIFKYIYMKLGLMICYCFNLKLIIKYINGMLHTIKIVFLISVGALKNDFGGWIKTAPFLGAWALAGAGKNIHKAIPIYCVNTVKILALSFFFFFFFFFNIIYIDENNINLCIY